MAKIGRYKKSEKESNMKSGNKNIVSKKKKISERAEQKTRQND